MSALSLATISLGVPAGATKPAHEYASKPGTPASEMVGTPGSSSEGCALATARARNLPALMCGMTDGASLNISWICPPSRSLTAGALPL